MSNKRADFYALVIGINQYLANNILGDLHGCIKDAEAFMHFFQSDLGVPKENITYLGDTDATRSRILEALNNLATDPRIPQNAAICIFYAGHGAEVESPPGWESGGPGRKIQTLVPHDYSDNDSSPNPAITDMELAKLINAICDTKGNNITVIFDCCHSASGTREVLEVEKPGLIRSAKVDLSYRIHATKNDPSFNQHRTSTGLTSGAPIGLQSHVLLAACRSTEMAMGTDNGNGCFSAALLSLFKKTALDTLRYSDIPALLENLPQKQHPQCEGFHQDRLIFNGNIPPCKDVVLSLKIGEGGVQSTLDGGTANGITIDAEFSIYNDRSLNPEGILGRFVVTRANLYTSKGTVTIGSDTLTSNQRYFCKQTKAGERNVLRIYVIPALTDRLREHLQRTEPYFSEFEIVQQENEAQIGIQQYGQDHVILRVIDPTLDPGRGTASGCSCLWPDLGTVLEAVAFFYWKRSQHDNIHHSVKEHVDVEFYRLKHEGRPAIFSVNSGNICQNKEVVLTISDNAEPIYYGIKLINWSPYDLFPAIFYFDSEDLSICSYYPMAGYNHKDAEAPLPKANCTGDDAGTPALDSPGTPAILQQDPHTSLTIGYGSGGALPFSFSVPPGHAYDVGLVKIFLFTRPVDVSDFAQTSPFDMHKRAGTEGGENEGKQVWGVIDIPIMQHRESSGDHGKS